MNIGEVIRIFRIANDWNIKEFAKKNKVSSTYITEVEKGNKSPSLKILQKFAEVLKVNLSDIFCIYEKSEENKWNFQKTLYEVLRIYITE